MNSAKQRVISLDRVVPLGRSFDEYRLIFALGPEHRTERILGVADGPASFNSEATGQGWSVTSVDPLYRFAAEDIGGRFVATVDDVMDQVRATPDRWVWSYHKNAGELRAHRQAVMDRFLADFASGDGEGRYIAAELPRLPFRTDSFDLALCSHFLFLYSDLFDRDFHVRAISEMLRVAREVRVFPLLDLDQNESPHLRHVLGELESHGCATQRSRVDYELQRGGNEQLIIRQMARS